MSSRTLDADVVVVGAGPVGLYTATLLAAAGADVVVLERRRERTAHSRAIGIHPPALAALTRAGAAEELVRAGVRIAAGEARCAGRRVARLSFGGVPGAHPFVLAVPQFRTEAVLERRAAEAGADLRRGVEARGLRQGITAGADRVELRTTAGPVAARFVIGADGARSTVRSAAGIGTRGRTYPDTYAMGDFAEDPAPDPTGPGRLAVLYLERDGIVESFPLPDGVRRWVVRTRGLVPQPTADWLAATVEARTGVALDPGRNSMLSSFAVRRRIADRFVRGRVALVGDAAHEVSPIGGQGMNLGWLDAAMLVPRLLEALQPGPADGNDDAGREGGSRPGPDVAARLRDYSAVRRRAALAAARQAHLNMALGRPLAEPWLSLRNGAIGRAAAAGPVHDAVARVFTMSA
ncbi:FAD-dependent oxidoreductase [Zhihengliuella sp.]|uniref:FAD-dependent oxidoreductase n=1 Tax=Zhihengliuella sp. TaxID=1954483 RepID=UPI0028122A8D|nr:FAD-dependent oxidoreductase [Zhihengliuella sp.]